MISSVGRAFCLHRNSQWFESVIAHMMLNNSMLIFFLFSIIFYTIQLIFFVYQTNSLHSKGRFLLFVLVYLIENLFIVFLLHFLYGKNFIFLMLETMQKNTVLKDPQDFLYILFNTGNFLLILCFFIIVFFLNHLFFSNMLRRSEHTVYISILIVFLYFFLLGFFIFFADLVTTHWEIFYQDKTFDFQPDLIRWFKYYKGELYDLYIQLTILISFILFSLLIFSNNTKSGFFYNTTFSLFYRIIFVFLLVTLSMTFFGGETFWRDVFILLFTVFCSELSFFTFLFFKTLKRYIFR